GSEYYIRAAYMLPGVLVELVDPDHDIGDAVTVDVADIEPNTEPPGLLRAVDDLDPIGRDAVQCLKIHRRAEASGAGNDIDSAAAPPGPSLSEAAATRSPRPSPVTSPIATEDPNRSPEDLPVIEKILAGCFAASTGPVSRPSLR